MLPTHPQTALPHSETTQHKCAHMHAHALRHNEHAHEHCPQASASHTAVMGVLLGVWGKLTLENRSLSSSKFKSL